MFKNPFLKTMGEFESFEQKLSILLTWLHIGHNECCTFFQYNPVSVDWLYHALVSRLKFGSLTLNHPIYSELPDLLKYIILKFFIYHLSVSHFLIFMAYFHTLEFVFIRTSISFVLLNHLEECDKWLTF